MLCVLADVKAFLGVTSSATDGVLNTLIANVSATIESFCNRTFASTVYTERRNGNDGYRLFLANGPVTAVSSVSVDGIAIIPAPDALTSGYLADANTVYLRGYTFTRGIQNVSVSYTAGFATIPLDVAQACIELVASHFAKRERIDKASETLGTQQTISYSQADMPAAAKLALKQRIWNTVP